MSFLTPSELMENPELAVLLVLKTSLNVAELALHAAYPDNCECSERCRSEQEAYVFAIRHQISTLEALLDEHLESLERLRERNGGFA